MDVVETTPPRQPGTQRFQRKYKEKHMSLKLTLLFCSFLVVAACESTSSKDAGTGCYNSDNQIDKTYKSPYECKSGGGTWK